MRGRRSTGGCCCVRDKGIDSTSRDGIERGYVAWRESNEGRVLESMLRALANVLGQVVGDVWINGYRFDGAEAVVDVRARARRVRRHNMLTGF